MQGPVLLVHTTSQVNLVFSSMISVASMTPHTLCAATASKGLASALLLVRDARALLDVGVSESAQLVAISKSSSAEASRKGEVRVPGLHNYSLCARCLQ